MNWLTHNWKLTKVTNLYSPTLQQKSSQLCERVVSIVQLQHEPPFTLIWLVLQFVVNTSTLARRRGGRHAEGHANFPRGDPEVGGGIQPTRANEAKFKVDPAINKPPHWSDKLSIGPRQWRAWRLTCPRRAVREPHTCCVHEKPQKSGFFQGTRVNSLN